MTETPAAPDLPTPAAPRRGSPTAALLADLSAEQEELDALVAGLPDADWDRATPAEGWTVRDTVGHLAFFDEQEELAAADPDRFRTVLAEVWADPEAFVAASTAPARDLAPADLLAWWRRARAASSAALAALPDGARLPWYGPDMSVPSAVTARLMETWAHGQDVWDAVGRRREPTERLRHICHLAHRTVGFAFGVHGLPAPDRPLRFDLVAPGGHTWSYGPVGAVDRVTGPALDLALLATQRRHRDDTALVAEGAPAQQWLELAQAFAGPPGPGRPPLDLPASPAQSTRLA